MNRWSGFFIFVALMGKLIFKMLVLFVHKTPVLPLHKGRAGRVAVVVFENLILISPDAIPRSLLQ